MIGWGVLGGWLHFFEEEAALRAANEYIQRASGTCGCGMYMYMYCSVDHAYITQQIHACSDVHCVCSSAFVDYTDVRTQWCVQGGGGGEGGGAEGARAPPSALAP